MKIRFVILLLSLSFYAVLSNASEVPNRQNLGQDLSKTNSKMREILEEMKNGLNQTTRDKELLCKKVDEAQILYEKRNKLREQLGLKEECLSEND